MMKLKRELNGWCPSDAEYAVYEEWETYQKYPYAGGFLDQPEWFFELRRKCALLKELVHLNSKQPEKKG
jgi:hypothetical protein